VIGKLPTVLLAHASEAAMNRWCDALHDFDVDIRRVTRGENALKALAYQDMAFAMISENLTDMRGIEVLRMLRRDASKWGVPVTLAANHDQVEHLSHAAYEAGAMACVAAPVRVGQLRAQLRIALHIHRQQRDLRHQNELLRQSNADFQQVAQHAAHDLRAPLRTILGFGNLLAGPDLTLEEVPEYGEVIAGVARRMDGLLQDMLDFARLDATTLRGAPVDLAECACEVEQMLRGNLEEVGGVLEVEALPVVTGSSQQLCRLLQNLVSNAIRYRRPGLQPLIKIRCSQEANRVTIRIVDNGVGFDMKWVEEVFLPFRRLQEGGERSGSGIGLAACRRIVERHRGEIWAESVPGVGSTFFVSLPVTSAEASTFRRRRRETRCSTLQKPTGTG